jgi:ribosomal protein L10
LAAGAELVIGKNTIVKKALEWRTSPLNPKMEDYDFYKKFGAPMP